MSTWRGRPEMLSHDELAFYRENGYLVLKHFAAADETALLRERAEKIIEDQDITEASLFSCSNKDRIKNDYFYKSASTISCFLEEGAVNSDGQLICDKRLAVNKIGHALHDLDPVFRRFSRSEKICALMKDLEYQLPVPVQSMYICKQPRIGGKVVIHQDGSFLMTDPPSVMGIWLALEDATLENGCLFVLPQSHKHPLSVRYGRSEKSALSVLEGGSTEWDPESFTALPVDAGTLVILHGNVVHFSHENHSDISRHAYSIHFVEGMHGYEWKKENWLQRPSDFPFIPLWNPREAQGTSHDRDIVARPP